MAALPIQLDRAKKTPLTAQIYLAIREGIENGRLSPGARLPSWQDLAAQLGVSRGTVRVAYERLIAEQFAIGLGPAGTRVAERQFQPLMPDRSLEAPLLSELFYEFGSAPLVFQMGVPSQDAFPFKLWSRILTCETRRAAAAPVTYPDPRGDPELRKEIAAYLGLARGIRCNPSQVFVTGGFSAALGLSIQGFQLGRMGAWMEDPGFPLTRTALGLAGLHVTAVRRENRRVSRDAPLRFRAGRADWRRANRHLEGNRACLRNCGVVRPPPILLVRIDLSAKGRNFLSDLVIIHPAIFGPTARTRAELCSLWNVHGQGLPCEKG